MPRRLFAALVVALASFTAAQAAPEPIAHDYVIKDFRLRTGETLPELKIRYHTLGTPRTDAAARVTFPPACSPAATARIRTPRSGRTNWRLRRTE